MDEEIKRRRGRKPQNKVALGHTFDDWVAMYIQSLQESKRSLVVNDAVIASEEFQKSPQYEQWKQSPAYDRWLKRKGRFMAEFFEVLQKIARRAAMDDRLISVRGRVLCVDDGTVILDGTVMPHQIYPKPECNCIYCTWAKDFGNEE